MPALLRKASGEHKIKLISMSSTSTNESELYGSNQQQTSLNRPSSVLDQSQIDLIMEENQENLAKPSKSQSYGTISEEHQSTFSQIGSVNVAYNDDINKN